MAILEHGLPLSDPLVLATVEERKSMSRQVVVPQPAADERIGCYYRAGDTMQEWVLADQYGDVLDKPAIRCPYGDVGDLLYIRQVWRMSGWLSKAPVVNFRADGAAVPWTTSLLPRGHDGALLPSLYHKTWMPGRLMPKAFARNWVQITGLRAERVQDIAAVDVYDEGVSGEAIHGICDREGVFLNSQGHAHARSPVIRAFRDLWDSLNAKRGYGWDPNPWAWVILYRLVSTTGRDTALAAVAAC